jgi:hypothetical protein
VAAVLASLAVLASIALLAVVVIALAGGSNDPGPSDEGSSDAWALAGNAERRALGRGVP